MIQEYKETWMDICNLWMHPYKTYQALMKKPLSLKPFMVLLVFLFLCSLISGIYLHSKALALMGNPQGFDGSLTIIAEIAQTDMIQYCISIFFAPIVSILSVAIMMFIMATMVRANTTFKQNVVLVSYAWTPMMIASVITTICACVFPVQISLTANTVFDYIIPMQFHNEFLYQVVSILDPFYIWTLVLLAMGASLLYKKGGKWWYLVIFVILELPVLVKFIGG